MTVTDEEASGRDGTQRGVLTVQWHEPEESLPDLDAVYDHVADWERLAALFERAWDEVRDERGLPLNVSGQARELSEHLEDLYPPDHMAVLRRYGYAMSYDAVTLTVHGGEGGTGWAENVRYGFAHPIEAPLFLQTMRIPMDERDVAIARRPTGMARSVVERFEAARRAEEGRRPPAGIAAHARAEVRLRRERAVAYSALAHTASAHGEGLGSGAPWRTVIEGSGVLERWWGSRRGLGRPEAAGTAASVAHTASVALGTEAPEVSVTEADARVAGVKLDGEVRTGKVWRRGSGRKAAKPT